MARLTVTLHGEPVAQLDLESGREYIAGRANDAAIHLSVQKGISRQHLKFFENENGWVCEALSKFGLLQKGTEQVQVLELTEATVFSVPPYEFNFVPTAAPVAQPDAAEDAKPAASTTEEGKSQLPAFFQPRVGANTNPGASGAEHTTPRANNEATIAGGSALVPYFRISYPNSTDDEVLKLEGDLWIAGRESSSEISIDSPHISRKHFELARTKEGFFITDLGSSNGTRVNGQKIPPHEPTRLESGDEIRVMNIEMTFEIRDTQFSNRLDKLPVPTFDAGALGMSGGGLPSAGYGLPPMVLDPTQYRSPEELAEYIAAQGSRTGRKRKLTRWQKLKANKVRLALVILVPIVLLMALLPSKPKPNPRTPAGGSSTPNFENLTKEQKLVVKDAFNLARNLYVQGKYALCLTELAKLHELIPQFENSKELQSFCEQGLELVRREEERQRQQREREEVESRIAGFVDQCKQQLGPEADVEETRRCLAPAIELNPEHNLVIELIHTAQMHEEEKKFQAEQKKATDAKAAKGVAAFNHAMTKYKAGQLAIALREFEKFLGSSYPRAESLKAQATRQVASITKELKLKVDSLLEQCKGHGAKGKFKDAYIACDKASQEDPDHAEAHEIKDRMLAELRREMKAIYEDSVLEESLGNVDSAKEKWKKIIQEDLSFDDYTTKSKSKLQKYGATP